MFWTANRIGSSFVHLFQTKFLLLFFICTHLQVKTTSRAFSSYVIQCKGLLVKLEIRTQWLTTTEHCSSSCRIKVECSHSFELDRTQVCPSLTPTTPLYPSAFRQVSLAVYSTGPGTNANTLIRPPHSELVISLVICTQPWTLSFNNNPNPKDAQFSISFKIQGIHTAITTLYHTLPCSIASVSTQILQPSRSSWKA